MKVRELIEWLSELGEDQQELPVVVWDIEWPEGARGLPKWRLEEVSPDLTPEDVERGESLLGRSGVSPAGKVVILS